MKQSDDFSSQNFWINNGALPGKVINSPQKSPRAIKARNDFIEKTRKEMDWDLADDHFHLQKSSKLDSSLNKNVLAHTSKISANSKEIEKSFKIPGSPQKFHLENDQFDGKIERFKAFLINPTSVEDLKKLSWSGVPQIFRPVTWQILCGYLPLNSEQRSEVLERKRVEYWTLVKQCYDNHLEITFRDVYHQIRIDVPRTNPGVALYQQKSVQKMFERILFVWSIRNPSSGYVQGMNDLVTPFFTVFLQDFLPESKDNIERLTAEERGMLEADTFWCLSKFMEGLHENYIFGQVGIQRNINQLKDLVQRVDSPTHKHLNENNVDYLQFSFRWFNNLLTRELPLYCIIRLWDTYLSEGDFFPQFVKYVCTAFLLHWKDLILLKGDFQSLMVFLQNLPTQNWGDVEISLVVAEAYRLRFMFDGAPKHLENFCS